MKKIFLAAAGILFTVSIFAFALKNPPKQSATISYYLPPSPTTITTPAALSIPILVYHHIGSPPKNANSATKSFFIEPEWFEKHLQYLQENNFQTVHFSDVIAYFKDSKPLPIAAGKRPVIINFDDAYKSVFTTAYPLLKKYNMTATIFVPANLIGHRAYLTWEQLQQLKDAGMEIGSHTLWHPYLTRSKKAREEIFESKKILEEKFGTPIQVFAYPFGDFNNEIEKLAQEAGYDLARSFTQPRNPEENIITRENFFRLPVVRVWGNIGLEKWAAMRAPHTPLSPY
ncbi:polysaccharide deacetylase family protein [Candidatus Peregrinibacteria bacterium]|nr:polysaccharide deacetylase family protein [Candidatus Peregrinibacteria bacterium]